MWLSIITRVLEGGQELGKQVTMEDCENYVYDKDSSIHHMF